MTLSFPVDDLLLVVFVVFFTVCVALFAAFRVDCVVCFAGAGFCGSAYKLHPPMNTVAKLNAVSNFKLWAFNVLNLLVQMNCVCTQHGWFTDALSDHLTEQLQSYYDEKGIKPYWKCEDIDRGGKRF